MKLALNGALTIGTLDGANIEIRDRVGADNIVIFGLRAEEVAARCCTGLDATDAISALPELAQAIGAIEAGMFSPDDPRRFARLTDRLRHGDRYMVAADFADYCAAQQRIEALWRSSGGWAEAAIANIAAMAWFSSDRTISEYARDIWGVPG